MTWKSTRGGHLAPCRSSSASTALAKWLSQSCTGRDAPSKLLTRRFWSFQASAVAKAVAPSCADTGVTSAATGETSAAAGAPRGVLRTLSAPDSLPVAILIVRAHPLAAACPRAPVGALAAVCGVAGEVPCLVVLGVPACAAVRGVLLRVVTIPLPCSRPVCRPSSR